MSVRKITKWFLLVTPFLIVFGFLVFLLTTRKQLAPTLACNSSDLSGVFDHRSQIATFEGQEIPSPLFARTENKATQVLGYAAPSERWIEVDLSEQKVKAWEGNSLFLETSVSTGLPGTPTPVGEYRIWYKLRYTKMEGGRGRYYYYLPNVPFTMFFESESVPGWRGYGLHGTYWHDSFGTPRSHGCVNLPTPIAERIFYWAGPVIPEGKSSVRASAENPGTRVLIHE